MNITQAYIGGWKTLFKTSKMWWALYAFQFALALLAIWPFSGYLSKTVGQSLNLQKSLGFFDYTFINDFLIEYGEGFQSLLDQSLGFILLYFLISVFLTGGILVIIKNREETDSYAGFFLGAGHFFWRILRLTFYFLIPQTLLLGLFFGLFMSITNNMSPFELESELVIINTVIWILPLYLLLAIILLMIQDLAKILLVHRDESWLTATIRTSFQIAFKHFWKFFPLYLLHLAVFLIISAIYYFLNKMFTPIPFWQVLSVFLIGQLYLFLRVGLKIVNLASINFLFLSLSSEAVIDPEIQTAPTN